MLIVIFKRLHGFEAQKIDFVYFGKCIEYYFSFSMFFIDFIWLCCKLGRILVWKTYMVVKTHSFFFRKGNKRGGVIFWNFFWWKSKKCRVTLKYWYDLVVLVVSYLFKIINFLHCIFRYFIHLCSIWPRRFSENYKRPPLQEYLEHMKKLDLTMKKRNFTWNLSCLK